MSLQRIMVVDDSRLMRKAVARILKNINDVVEARDGAEAWEMLQADKSIKIVCCDLIMPELDGFGFLKLVRDSNDERMRDLPVIIITGQEDTEENRNKIFEAGASDFVSKPFDSAHLRASIKTHTRLEKTTKALQAKTSEFEDAAAVDPLTGLGTPAFFMKSAEQAISFAQRHDKQLVVVRMEIDGFRELFLKLGKETSYALIKRVGEILSTYSRQEDMVCRMGLDGFVVLLRTCDLAGAAKMTERVRETTENIKLQHGIEQEHATVSVGVVKLDVTDKTTVDGLLEAAGEFLLQAQKAGGNKVAYDKAMAQQDVVQDLTIDQALYLISKGQSEKVAGQIDGIIRRISPLLGLYARINVKGLKLLIQQLQERIR